MDVLSEVLQVLQLKSSAVHRFEISPGDRLNFGNTSTLAAVFAVRESAVVEVQQQTLLLSEGEGALLGTQTSPRRISFAATQPARVVAVRFALDLSAPHPVCDALREPVRISADALMDRTEMGRTLALLDEELVNRRIGTDLVALRFCDVLLVEMLRRRQLDSEGTASFFTALQDPVVLPVLEHLHGSPGQPWTLKALGDAVALTGGAMAERFQRHVGLPPLTYLRRWRLLTGRARLTASGQPIGGIARSLGYASTGGFSRAFRRLFGISPKQYRERHNH